MNFKKTCMLFVFAALIVAAFAVDGQCDAGYWICQNGWHCTWAKAATADGVDRDRDCAEDPTPCWSSAESRHTTWPEGYAFAFAYAEADFGWSREITDGFAEAKGGPQDPYTDFVAIDTARVTMDSVDGGVELHVEGRLRAYGEMTPFMQVYLYYGGYDPATGTLHPFDENRVLWGGGINLFGLTDTFQTGGAFHDGWFADSLVGDTIELNFNFTTATIPYAESYDSIGVWVQTDVLARKERVPALTNYGLIVLLALLILSGIYVIYQRRRGTVRA